MVSNLSVAGYLAQLPRIEDALFGRGMLTTLGIGVGSGLAWMLVRGAFSRGDVPEHGRQEDPPPSRRAGLGPASVQPPSLSAPPLQPGTGRIRTIAPPQASAPSHRASAQPPAPAPPAAPSYHPYAQPRTGETMAGFPATYASTLPSQPPTEPPFTLHGAAPPARGSAPADPQPFKPHANQTGSTLHGWSSSPPGMHGSLPPPALSSMLPAKLGPAPRPAARSDALAATRQDGFAQARADAFSDGGLARASDPSQPSRPSGPPTMRMNALQEAELAASPEAARPGERASEPRLSWPPLELTPRTRSSLRPQERAGEPTHEALPASRVPMAVLSRAVPTPPPANDAVRAGYIDTVGEPALTVGETAPESPLRTALTRRVAARVDVVHGEASPTGERLEPELLEQLEELRAEVLTTSPSHCFVVGVSSDGDHGAIKSGLAVDLALQLSQSGSRRVLLIEANATRPMLDRALSLHVPLAAGFSQQMHRRMTASSPSWTVLRVAPTLDVLAEGRFRTPGMLYGSVFAVALHELRDHYDVIVADGPVVETSEAAAAFAQVVDGIGYVTSGLPSIRVSRERALARFKDKPLFKVLTTR